MLFAGCLITSSNSIFQALPLVPMSPCHNTIKRPILMIPYQLPNPHLVPILHKGSVPSTQEVKRAAWPAVPKRSRCDKPHLILRLAAVRHGGPYHYLTTQCDESKPACMRCIHGSRDVRVIVFPCHSYFHIILNDSVCGRTPFLLAKKAVSGMPQTRGLR